MYFRSETMPGAAVAKKMNDYLSYISFCFGWDLVSTTWEESNTCDL